MKKSFLLTVAVIALVFSGYAQEQQFETIRLSAPRFKQAEALAENSVLFGYGTDNITVSLAVDANTVRVACMIPKQLAAKYANAQITKIHVGLGVGAATNTKVFITEGLVSTLTYTQDANLQADTWNVVPLSQPYVITGTSDVLIGYEYTSNKTYTIGLDDSSAPCEHANYFSTKSGSSYSAWSNLADYGYYNVALKASIEGNSFPQQDVTLSSVETSSLNVFTDAPFSITTTVFNNASLPVNNYKITYKAGSRTYEDLVTASIQPFKNYSFSKDIQIDTEGVYSIEATISEINGLPDEDMSDNSLSFIEELWVGNSAPTIQRNRNILIEEYTGIYCVYCPEGHKLANQLKSQYPSGRVSIINIHQGGYASPKTGDPDYRTTWGNALANQTGLGGYPSGTVNRHVFSGTKTALGRGSWASAARTLINEASPVNLQASAHIDRNTRSLTVDVSGYYTANSNKTSNMLNVALLQENVLGPQTGADTFYPEMKEGGLYRHNHMLRELLTGQWGDSIQQTTSGSSFTKQYVYQIPATFNQVPVNLDNLTVVAFITESKQEVITATESQMTHTYSTPNPTIRVYFAAAIYDGFLYIDSTFPVQDVDIYNISGQKIISQKAVAGNTIPVNRLEAGVYIVKAKTVDGAETVVKVIK